MKTPKVQSPRPQPITEPSAPAPTKRGARQSGYSLLARGEPQIWFAGGMLIICLAMIMSLVAFILYSGLPTFWPREVQWLVLNDGSLEIGQLQATTRGVVDAPSAIDNSSATVQSSLDSENTSRYFRTGNYDLTGQHYRWLTSAELIESGIAAPDWAMVVERLSSGRLYGLLGQLTILSDIGAQARSELTDCQELRTLMAGLPNLDSQLQADSTAAIDAHSGSVLNRALRMGSNDLASKEGVLQFKTRADAAWQLAGDVPSEEPIVDARILVTGEIQTLEPLQSAIADATKRRQQVERVRYQISRADARLSELRAELRRAELQTNTQVAKQIESSHYLLEQLASAESIQTELATRKILLQQISASAPWNSQALTALDAYTITGLPAQLSELESQLSQWYQPISQQPTAIRSAVEAYLTGYRRIASDKRPLERELKELDAQLKLGQVAFWVPSGPMAIDFSSADIDQLLQGQLSQAALEQMQQQSIVLESSIAQVQTISDRLQLATVKDKQQERHLLAIVSLHHDTAQGSGDTTDVSPAAAESKSDPSIDRRVLLLKETVVEVQQIVRAIPANQLGLTSKFAVYLSRWREFLLENPREANSEGGVFPAIWGTIVMTLIMTIAVVPFGVMAALYLREYTKSGFLVSMIRISINNLAGVPSIVYGVFGFSFFCYTIGAFIDGGAKNADIVPWPSKIWFMALATTAVAGTVAFFFSFASSGPAHSQTGFKRFAARGALLLWLLSVAAIAILILKSPFFDGFYREYLPNPTFGKGGLLWAALTLSLLTLPVVIVATEEALAAVPNSLREGSLACGASKWQTIYRIILPHARPGILTGAILAMARGAGEVAPLMLVGALASAPDLPLDTEFPFFHGSRSFMHLGYQIYTLGFQSQNSEAARAMVFTCTLLLILIVAALNITAIYLRARLKRQFQGNQF